MTKKKGNWITDNSESDLIKYDDNEYKDDEIEKRYDEIEKRFEEDEIIESKFEIHEDTQGKDDVTVEFTDHNIQKILNSFEDTNPDEDDEFTIDPRTGSRAFKLDEYGCRKGWEWDFTLGRCVPKKLKK